MKFLISYVFQPTMEGMWAMKAMEHADIHFNVSKITLKCNFKGKQRTILRINFEGSIIKHVY